jgi:hypothetical protein
MEQNTAPEPEADSANPDGLKRSNSVSSLGRRIFGSGSSIKSGTSIGSRLKAPTDGIAAMLHGLKRLPSDVLASLSSRNAAQLKREIVALEIDEDRAQDEAQLDEALKTAEQNAHHNAESDTAPGAEPCQRGLDTLLRDMAADPALRAVCLKHKPEAQGVVQSVRTTIHPEVALLSYHQMRHEQRVCHAKRQLVAAGDQLRKLKATEGADPGDLQAAITHYKKSLANLLAVGVLDFRLERLDALVDDMVKVGREGREEVKNNLLNKFFIDGRSKGTLVHAHDVATVGTLGPPMSLAQARWQARMFVTAAVPDCVGLEILHGKPEFQGLRQLATDYVTAEEKSQELKTSGGSDADLKKQADHKESKAKALAKQQASLGIDYNLLSHLPDKIMLPHDSKILEHVMKWDELKDELIQPEVRAAYSDLKLSAEPGSSSEACMEVLVHVMQNSPVHDFIEEQKEHMAEYAYELAPAAAIVPKLARHSTYTTQTQRQQRLSPAEFLKMVFRGDDLDDMASRCEKVGLNNLCRLMHAIAPRVHDAKEGFADEMKSLFCEAVVFAEKDSAFCSKLKAIWGDRQEEASGICGAPDSRGIQATDLHRQNYRKAHPEVAELAINRLKMMVRAKKIDAGNVAKEALVQFRFALLAHSLCQGQDYPVYRNIRSRSANNVEAAFFGDSQGLANSHEAIIASSELHPGTVATTLFEAQHALNDRFDFGLTRDFEHEHTFLVDQEQVKDKTKTLRQAHITHQSNIAAATMAISDRTNAMELAVLDATVESFMDWAMKYQPLRDIFKEKNPSVHEEPTTKHTSEDPGVDKEQAVVDRMQLPVNIRLALGKFLKDEGIFKELGQAQKEASKIREEAAKAEAAAAAKAEEGSTAATAASGAPWNVRARAEAAAAEAKAAAAKAAAAAEVKAAEAVAAAAKAEAGTN